MTIDAQSHNIADWYWLPVSSGMLLVKWKNLADGTLCGPDPILVWGRMAICVFPQDPDSSAWVPEHLFGAVDFSVQKPDDRTEPRDQIDTDLSTEELLGS